MYVIKNAFCLHQLNNASYSNHTDANTPIKYNQTELFFATGIGCPLDLCSDLRRHS